MKIPLQPFNEKKRKNCSKGIFEDSKFVKGQKILLVQQTIKDRQYTDKNNLDKSHKLVKYFLDFPLWEKRIAYFK